MKFFGMILIRAVKGVIYIIILLIEIVLIDLNAKYDNIFAVISIHYLKKIIFLK